MNDDGLDGMGGHLPKPDDDVSDLITLVVLIVALLLGSCGLDYYITRGF